MKLKDEDITIYGAYTLIEPDNVTELEPEKEAKDLGGGVANITLEARAKSKTIKVVTANPVDVILVLDQSGSMADSLSADGKTKKRDGSFKSYDFNRFLHAVSSNYPNAGSIKVSEMGEGNKNSGYYFAVNNTDNLSSIFTKILYGKVYEVVSFDKVTLFDTISKEFTLTLEQETEMRERLIKEQGMKNEDITVKRNTDGTTSLRFENVRVQKVFNADSSMYYSAKVSFNVSANEESLEKDGKVETSTEDAGIEYDGTVVDEFEVQSINLDVDRKIVGFTVNGVVYRIDKANLGDKIVAPVTEFAQWNIPESTVVTGNCAVFEANVIDSKEYVVTWNSEGTTKTETYSYASVIKAHEAVEKEGYCCKGS